jgi:uncharacterized protein
VAVLEERRFLISAVIAMKTLLPLLLVLGALPAAAQPAPRTLTVAGEGTVAAPPDRAVLSFSVVTEAPTAAAAMERNEEEALRVLTAVRGFGVPDRHIQMLQLMLHENYRGEARPEGYVAVRSVVVTTDSLRQVPDLVATVVSEGANRFEGLQYTVRDFGPLRDRALEEAVRRARERAEVAARAAGVRLGAVVQVLEQGLDYRPPVPIPVRAEAVDVAAASGTPGAFSAGQVEVRAAVAITYEIETP